MGAADTALISTFVRRKHMFRTYCQNGHEFTAESTTTKEVNGVLRRTCLICKEERESKRPKALPCTATDTHCPRGHEFNVENTEIKINHGREYRRCRECHREDQRNRQRRDKDIPERRKALRKRRRKAQLKTVGWTPELFDKAFEEQDQKCAICKKPLELHVGQKEARACADHKHVIPPKPRGIICPQCNVGIGNLQDSPEVLEAAAEYLRRY